MREPQPGRYVVQPSAWLPVAIVLIAVVLALVLVPVADDPAARLVLIGLPFVVALYALLQLLRSPSLTIDTPARRYTWRPSRFPWQSSLSGHLDEDVRALQLQRRPCGSRRACISGWHVVLLFNGPPGEVRLDEWLDRDQALAACGEWSRLWAVPALNEDGEALQQAASGRA